MPQSFWLQFAIEEAVTVASAFVQVSTLTSQQKADLEAFIAAAQKLSLDF
jgi:hypothetical protein